VDRKRLILQVDCLPVVAQAQMAKPQVVEAGGLVVAVPGLPGDVEGLGVEVDRLVTRLAAVSLPRWLTLTAGL
jgi:hypothetical protein